MRRIASFTAVLVLLGIFMSATSTAAQESPIVGGWILASWETPGGRVISDTEGGLFTFTASGQYSIMYVVPFEQPRAQWSGDTQSDAEKVASYDSFVANSGRYSVDGNEITYEAFMAKNPNYMADFEPTGGNGNAVTMTFSIENEVLTLRFTSGNGAGATATFERPPG